MKQPWLKSASFDTAFILLPPIFATAFVFLLQLTPYNFEEVPVWGWVLFVLFIDVAHVYSTLYRTYFDQEEFEARRELYTMVPMFAFVGALLLHALSPLWFWRALAYIAVFHFVRQQYGFMMLYRRQEITANWEKWLDRSVIYLSTLYPIAFWHTHLPRNFSWFIEGDFFFLDAPWASRAVGYIYVTCLFAYFAKELQKVFVKKIWNVPKNLILIGTATSWYVGIVLLNGDMAFTVTNVVTHGLPYVALVWFYTSTARKQKRVWPSALFS
ncbi:MAG: hypothetical protein AAF202_01925, partial [Pseudomonadota bacterium]